MRQPLGTDDAVSIAVDKYADMVRRICFLYLNNYADVEDVFQEVFLKFFLNKESLQNEEHQKAWLCRVTFNRCKDLCKSFWKKRVVSIEETEIPYENTDQRDIIGAIMLLPSNDKELIYWHYFEGRTIPEISGIMKKNPNTVYSQLRRAKERLKQKVGELI